MPGYRIVRVQYRRPVPLDEGFDRIERIITAAGRPLTAFCACELRSPAPFTESGFAAFNKIYVGTLQRWKIFDGVTNPVARSNVCPAVDPPSEPSFHAFAYTEAASDAEASFVIAGSGEAPEGRGNYRDHIVRLGDVSTAGLREKARFVLGEMERRMKSLAAGIAKAGSTDTEKLITAFRGLEVKNGPFGTFTFRAIDHQATVGAYVGKIAVKDGKGTMSDFKYVDGSAVMPPDDEVRKLRPAAQ